MFFRTATSQVSRRGCTKVAWLLGLFTSLVVVMSCSAHAQSDGEGSPPSRVGRIGLIEGDVSFFADRDEGWRKARVNYPVTSKNSVWTNGPARAEVRFGASAVRLDADTMLDVVKVDDQRTNLFLQRGVLNTKIRAYVYSQRGARSDDYSDQFRIETDSGTWILDQSGRYRIEASPDRAETRLAVFVGTARFENGSANLKVEQGKMLVVRGTTSASSFTFERANEASFDRWAEARDVRWDETHQRAASTEVISPYMTGYEDLDANGDWIDDNEYGRLWTPRTVVAGWVPYRYGSWSYVRPWGWTWIDDAPWGFAPFHYGRWVQIRTRWYWTPGRYHFRPIYAPALVTWFGDGNTSISISVGPSVGWCPLAPREHYVPAYTNNVTYIRNINYVTNNVTVINRPTRYVNQQNGGTVVGHNVVVGGEPVWRQPNLQVGSRIQKPMRDPQGGVDPNAPPRWVPSNPPPGPAAPTPVVYPGAPRPTAIGGEAPISRRPTWVVGEPARPQTQTPSNTQPVQGIDQPAPVSSPAVPRATSPTQPISAPEPMAPMARPKPNPRVITSTEGASSTGGSTASTVAPRESLPPRSEPVIATDPVRRERIERPERVERAERTERVERVERMERERVNPAHIEPRPLPTTPPNEVRVVRPEPTAKGPRNESKVEPGRQGSGATPGAVVVKPKEGREEKPAERGERAPKTANQ